MTSQDRDSQIRVNLAPNHIAADAQTGPKQQTVAGSATAAAGDCGARPRWRPGRPGRRHRAHGESSTLPPTLNLRANPAVTRHATVREMPAAAGRASKGDTTRAATRRAPSSPTTPRHRPSTPNQARAAVPRDANDSERPTRTETRGEPSRTLRAREAETGASVGRQGLQGSSHLRPRPYRLCKPHPVKHPNFQLRRCRAGSQGASRSPSGC